MTKPPAAELFDSALVNARLAAYDRASSDEEKRHDGIHQSSLDEILTNAKKIENYLLKGKTNSS